MSKRPANSITSSGARWLSTQSGGGICVRSARGCRLGCVPIRDELQQGKPVAAPRVVHDHQRRQIRRVEPPGTERRHDCLPFCVRMVSGCSAFWFPAETRRKWARRTLSNVTHASRSRFKGPGESGHGLGGPAPSDLTRFLSPRPVCRCLTSRARGTRLGRVRVTCRSGSSP